MSQNVKMSELSFTSSTTALWRHQRHVEQHRHGDQVKSGRSSEDHFTVCLMTLWDSGDNLQMAPISRDLVHF